MKTTLALLTGMLIAASIPAFAADAGISSAPFGKTPDGTPVTIYTLRNTSGMQARIMTYGGIVVSLTAPDRDGKMADVVLGYDSLDKYTAGSPFYGALIGRYANRIARGQFDLEGTHYKLNPYGYTTLHGGARGFDKVVWQAAPLDTPAVPALRLTYLSKDGEEGFPGNLTVTATYTLTDKNELRLDLRATTDKPTVLNLTNHSYFNLAGQGEGDILGHELTINADQFVAIGNDRLPTGGLRSVDGTPLDFRKPSVIGSRINADYDQLSFAGGYDHCWVINKNSGELALMARLFEPKTGRLMEVLSTEPALQFYAGVNMDDDIGKGGKAYHVHSALCLEASHYPDSPNHANFPTTELKPGEVYQSTIIYRFSAESKAAAKSDPEKAGGAGPIQR